MDKKKKEIGRAENAVKKKVLLFTLTAGAGHNVVAANIKAKFDEKGFETKTIDLFGHDPKITKMLSGYGFKAMFKFPKITNFIWRQAKKKETGLYDRLIKKVKDVIIPQINDYAPDVIVSSHVAGQILIHWYGNEIIKPFKNYMIMTDYEVPPTLKPFSSEESYIVVPTADFKKELEEKGYNSNKLLPFGIPINEKFYKTLSRTDVLSKLNMPGFDVEAPTVLMMGGGKGLGKIAGVVKRLSANPEIQIITVCGRNEDLKNKIDNIILQHSKSKKSYARIYNYGFCTNVEELMTVAHFSVGKTGGISSTEAIAKGLQVVSFKRIPNPELSNLKYLESKGLAKSVNNIAQLEYYVALKPDQRAMSNALIEYSADKIVSHTL